MIVNIGELCLVLFRCCSLSEWIDAKRSEWFAVFWAYEVLDARTVYSIPACRGLYGKSFQRIQPHDVLHFFSIEDLVGEEIVHDRRERRPVIFSIQRLIKPRGRLLQIGQAFAFEWKEWSGRFPIEFPIRCPLSGTGRC